MSSRLLLLLVTTLTILSTGTRLVAQPRVQSGAIVSDQEVDRYVASFKSLPRPSVEPKINYRTLVGQLGTPVSWFVGQWLPPGGEGEINIYPAAVNNHVCILIKTPKSISYSDATLNGKVLRTSNPLFTDATQNYLKYANSNVLVPVLYEERGYLGWGVFDPAHKRSRFLTLAFNSVPVDPVKLLTGKTGAAILAQFQAAGCRSLTQSQQTVAPIAIAQTIDNVSVQVQPVSANKRSRTFQLRIANRSTKAFGFMPNRVLVYDQNRRRLVSDFSTLVYGSVIQPGGSLQGTVTVYTQSANSLWLQIPEATPDRRTFTLAISP